eukprot:gene20960-27814_t
MVPSEYVGSPDYYIIYACSRPFEAVLESVERHIRDDSNAPKYETEHEKEARVAYTYVWIDWIAINQHALLFSKSVDLSHVRNCVDSCSKGAICVLDPKLTPITRAWCLYEMWCFVYYGNMGLLQVSLPEEMDVGTIAKFDRLVSDVNLGRSDFTRKTDSSRIMSEAGEYGNLQQILKCFTYSTNLLNSSLLTGQLAGEYGNLQQTLYSVAGITESDAVLEEIRGIYNTFDADGSGSLDENTFVAMLNSCGFEEEESHRIFNEVDYGGGGVDLEEFETWWLGSQRQEAQQQLRTTVMRADALIINVEKFRDLLIRNELHDDAKTFQEYIKAMKQGNALFPTPLRGNWQDTVEQSAWKLHKGDVEGTCKMMYETLMWNGEQLESDPLLAMNPHEITDRHEMCENEVLVYMCSPYCYEAGECLRQLLGLMCGLLSTHGGKRQHATMFQGIIDELSDPKAVNAMITRMQTRRPGGGGQEGLSRFAIMRGMISLKYGDKATMSKSLLAEAEKSLEEWMASTRKDKVMADLLSTYMGVCDHGEDTDQKTGANLKLSELTKRAIHDIPAEGPFESLLKFMGPEALSYLAEEEAKEAANPTYHPRASTKEKDSVLQRIPVTRSETKGHIDFVPPSHETKHGGFFQRVCGSLKRIQPFSSVLNNTTGLRNLKLPRKGLGTVPPIDGRRGAPSQPLRMGPEKGPTTEGQNCRPVQAGDPGAGKGLVRWKRRAIIEVPGDETVPEDQEGTLSGSSLYQGSTISEHAPDSSSRIQSTPQLPSVFKSTGRPLEPSISPWAPEKGRQLRNMTSDKLDMDKIKHTLVGQYLQE